MSAKALLAKLPKPKPYYDVSTRRYWLPDAHGDFINLDDKSLQRHLLAQGFSKDVPKGQNLSAMDREFVRIQTRQNVAFAGPLAGWKKGQHVVHGKRILVTEEFRLVDPKERPFPIINQMLTDLFGEQRHYVECWLKIGVEALMANEFLPGQALVLAGPAGSGKSLFQKVATLLLGGRAAKPYQQMVGLTPFNRDLIGAEHQVIEDEVPIGKLQARRHFGARIKDICVNEDQRWHAKGVNAVLLKVAWRLTISLNDEEENLTMLPPVDESLRDKLMLFKVGTFTPPMPTGSVKERKAFFQALEEELPGFMDHLLKRDIPEALRCNRYGVTHWHDPALLAALKSLAPETQFLSIIDSVLWVQSNEISWEGTAESLTHRLMASPFRPQVESLLHFGSATGKYLGRLEATAPERVQRTRTNSDRLWTITRRKT